MLCLRFYFGKGEIVVAVRREEKSRLSLAIVIASEAKIPWGVDSDRV